MTELFNAELHITVSKDGKEIRITTAHQTIVLDSLEKTNKIIQMLLNARAQMARTKGDRNV